MADTTSDPLLDLQTLETRFVRINGTNYELRHPGQLTIIEDRRLRRTALRLAELLTQMKALGNNEDLADAEATELEALNERICRMMLVADEATHAKLTDLQRLAISQVFFPPTPATTPPAATEQAADAPSTGAN